MLFGKNKDVPPEVAAVSLGKWYSELSDQNKVKLGRYLKIADTSSKYDFIISVMDKAIDDHNYSLAALVGAMGKDLKLHDLQHYDVNERMVLAYYNLEKYEECLACCEEGLAMVSSLKKQIFERSGGEIPDDMYCRNYKINVLIGVEYDYDAGDKALDEFYEMGILSKEDLDYRKQSTKIFRLQKTFDAIYTVKVKDDQ